MGNAPDGTTGERPAANPYETVRQEDLAPFSGCLQGTGAAAFLVVSSREHALDAAAKEALTQTAKRLGYGPDRVEWAVLPPAESAVLVEALDPCCVVSTDAAATKELALSYRAALPLQGMGRLWCRPCACLEDFAKLLRTPEGKRAAWNVLKELPKLEG